MVDFETVRFMGMLDKLAALSANGIVPFSEATQESWSSHQYLFFDDSAENFRIVCDACIDELHHDIVSYYSGADYIVRAICEEDEQPFVEIMSADGQYTIVVEDGVWYFVT